MIGAPLLHRFAPLAVGPVPELLDLDRFAARARAGAPGCLAARRR